MNTFAPHPDGRLAVSGQFPTAPGWWIQNLRFDRENERFFVSVADARRDITNEADAGLVIPHRPLNPTSPRRPVMSEHTVNGGARAVNQKRRTRNIPYKIKREIWSMPCTICGGREDVLVDHIIPYSKGGTNDRSNLQPLCWICNAKKGNRLTNDQLRAWFEANREDILLRHDYRRETRYVNEYDGVSFEFWKRARLARLGRNTANG